MTNNISISSSQTFSKVVQTTVAGVVRCFDAVSRRFLLLSPLHVLCWSTPETGLVSTQTYSQEHSLLPCQPSGRWLSPCCEKSSFEDRPGLRFLCGRRCVVLETVAFGIFACQIAVAFAVDCMGDRDATPAKEPVRGTPRRRSRYCRSSTTPSQSTHHRAPSVMVHRVISNIWASAGCRLHP